MPTQPSQTPGRGPNSPRRVKTPPGAGLDPELQAKIGRQLQELYRTMLEEPVPERFLRLLAELERKQENKG